MKPAMLHTAYKLTTIRNAYGDYISDTTTTSMPCHFRYITQAVAGASNETILSNAMAWFEPDASISKGDVIQVDSEYFKIDTVTKARRLRNPAVLFLKCALVKYGFIS